MSVVNVPTKIESVDDKIKIFGAGSSQWKQYKTKSHIDE